MTLQTFLSSVKPDILLGYPQLKKTLFPNSGVAKTFAKWDLNTVCIILKQFCCLGSNLKAHLTLVIDLRNELCHMPWPQLSEQKYQELNCKVKMVMRDFMHYMPSNGFEKEISERIRSTETEPFDAEQYRIILREIRDLKREVSSKQTTYKHSY